jgi:hypothetical protein
MEIECGLIYNETVERYLRLISSQNQGEFESWREGRGFLDNEFLQALTGQSCPQIDVIREWANSETESICLTTGDINMILRHQPALSMYREDSITEVSKGIADAVNAEEAAPTPLPVGVISIVQELLDWRPEYPEHFWKLLASSSWEDESPDQIRRDLQQCPYLTERIYYCVIDTKDDARTARSVLNTLHEIVSRYQVGVL